MKRIKQVVSSVIGTVAVAVALTAPASASDGTSLNAELNDGTPAPERSSHQAGYSSLNATLQDGGARSVDLGPQLGTVGSPTAILGSAGQPDASPVSIVGGDDGGFEWGDAIIGAASALGLALLASGALVVSRRRRNRDSPVPA